MPIVCDHFNCSDQNDKQYPSCCLYKSGACESHKLVEMETKLADLYDKLSDLLPLLREVEAYLDISDFDAETQAFLLTRLREAIGEGE